jgi:tetratricopeptide (TPR) repeat protein
VPLDPERQLLEQIQELRSKDGPTAEALIDPLRALALLYQEGGDHAVALAALQEARQILRVRRGLFTASVDEALLLRQQIPSEKALGNPERVWNLEQDLLVIARQHLDDMRMLPIFLDLIDDRTELLDAYRATKFTELPAGIYVPCDPEPVGRGGRVVASDARNCPFGSFREVVARLDAEIMLHYAEAIEVLVKNGDYASRELRDLEKEALRRAPFGGYVGCSRGTVSQLLATELVGGCLEPLRQYFFGGTDANVGGWASLMRLLVYEIRSHAPADARATAFAELGDWYMLAEHLDPRRRLNRSDELAVALYRRAYTELRQGDDAGEAMARIFSPDRPITLPAYAPNALESKGSSRYVDVAFAISELGEAERIEITAKSGNVTRADERDVIRLIESTSFRPRAVGGELATSAPVTLRYHLPENPASTTLTAR